MAKNNESKNNVETTPEQAMDALYPQPVLTPEVAMEALFPPAPVVDPYAKVPDDVKGKAIVYQHDEERANMVDKIRKAVASIPNSVDVLKGCAIGDAFHPEKLAKAIESHLPANWEKALRDDVDKTPHEQLAGIVVGVGRGIVTAQAQELLGSYGLTKDEQTRSIKKAVRSKVAEQVATKIPLKVAKATQATYKDRLLEMMKAIIAQ